MQPADLPNRSGTAAAARRRCRPPAAAAANAPARRLCSTSRAARPCRRSTCWSRPPRARCGCALGSRALRHRSLSWLAVAAAAAAAAAAAHHPRSPSALPPAAFVMCAEQVVLRTTLGDLDIELWPKEAPKACRNFVQVCTLMVGRGGCAVASAGERGSTHVGAHTWVH